MNSIFYFYITPEEILNFLLFTHEEFKRSISQVYQAFVRERRFLKGKQGGAQTSLRGNTQANSPVNQGADIVNSENKPWGLYFLEGLMLGGAYVQREICV